MANGPHTCHVPGKGEVGEWLSGRTKCICDLKPKPAKPPCHLCRQSWPGGSPQGPRMGGSLPLGPRQRASFSPTEAPKRQDEGAAKPSAQQHPAPSCSPRFTAQITPGGSKECLSVKMPPPGGKEGESVPLSHRSNSRSLRGLRRRTYRMERLTCSHRAARGSDLCDGTYCVLSASLPTP